MKTPSRLIGTGVLGAIFITTAMAMVPVDLRCDGQVSPIAASATPRLSWRVESDQRGAAQSAWQVLVARSAEQLAKDKGDLWDSGKTAIKREPQVLYSGSPLVPGAIYHWKVRSWDKAGKPSPWSAPATMEIAPMKPADWHGAKWIDDGRDNPQKDEDFYKPDPAPLLRHEFKIAKPVVRARLHVAGLGYALTSLNGERLADQALDPPWTNFDKRILFRTHDVTHALAEGANCIGITLGNGWYNPLPLRMWGVRNIRIELPNGRPRAVACLVAEHADGTRTIITTGPEWKVTQGPTLRNNIFLGEERDARLAIPGWDKPGFDTAAWQPVRINAAPLQNLMPLLDMPPVRSTEVITPVAITSPNRGTYIVDFGRNFTGVPEIKISAPAGKSIVLRFGEILHSNGTLNPLTSICGQIKGMRRNDKGEEYPIGGPGAPLFAWQQDIYTACGGTAVTYRPDFTFHAFRYMEITGLPDTPRLEDIRGIRLNSDLAAAGSFSCSNELLNNIQKITLNTFLSNIVSVQSDCPHRERFGYGGDVVTSGEAFLMNFDMAGFYQKVVRDFSDAARPDGNFTDTAPFVGVQYCGVGWAMAHPLLLEQLYQHYGNKALVAEQLPAAMRWFDLEASKRENGLVVKGLGDHEALEKVSGPVIITPMFIDTARRMARLCRIIGKDGDATRFDAMADESTKAWAERFLDPESGKVGGGSQSEHVFALGYGGAPESARSAVFDRLVENLTAPEDGPRLSTGIYATRLLMELLTRNQRHDLAMGLAIRRSFPSWGWMLENDATTLWETWKESDNTFSHNHPMFGSISAWFFRHLGGIQIADDAVGADRIVIHPQTGHGLTWVQSSHRTCRGLIVSNWKTVDGGTEFEITIPPDTTATLRLPAGTLTESGKALAESEGLSAVQAEGDGQQLVIGSGNYRFLLQP